MRNPTLPARNRAELLARSGILAVVRGREGADPEPFVTVLDDGRVIAFNGHVDLGTGIRTSLAQIVAEEIGLAAEDVEVVLSDLDWAPDQGPTIASETIQVTAKPLRSAAAQARTALIALAAQRFGYAPDQLDIRDGRVVGVGNTNVHASLGELVSGVNEVLELDPDAPTKDPAAYTVVGSSPPRVDVPAKAFGELIYVHDVRVPGMVHGRVVRPPYAGRDHGAFMGKTLVAVDETSIAHVPGILAVVVVGDFVGIVAEREEDAEAAMRALKVDWGPFNPLPDLNEPEMAIRANPRQTRLLVDEGDVDAALGDAATRLTRKYVWPYQMHGSIGPCCSVAAFDEAGHLTVWTGTQTQAMLHADLATLLDMPPEAITLRRMEASGSYGRSGMDDVGGDAALLARAVGRPVRVQLTREQEHMWEPKGTAQLMEVDGGIDAEGRPYVYDYQSSYPSNISPMLTLLLTGKIEPVSSIHTSGDRSSIPPYGYPNLRIAIHDMEPIARASFFRGVSALPTTFAQESYIDELAAEAGADPVEYRLANLADPRASDLVRAVADRAEWEPHVGARKRVTEAGALKGQGIAQARYVHGPWPGVAAAWSAWAVDVEVDPGSGEIAVTRVVAGQDTGSVVNPEGVRHQIQGNVIQATSRTLHEKVSFDDAGVTSRDWSTYPLLNFPQVPRIQVVQMPRPTEEPLGAAESGSVPSAAAIANAVYDATGVRFRELPLTPERVKAGLDAAAGVPPRPALAEPEASPVARRGFKWKTVAAAGLALATAGWALWPMKPPIRPVAPKPADFYSAATVERGRVLAEAGDCAVCHTVEGGVPNAGGRAIETPFGAIYATNITPDVETGIGTWSFAAFQRAMRHGISRDGRHLYPAFPYTSFTKMTDGDLEALYAYLMSQPPVRAETPQTRLAFPYNVRPAMALWNAINLSPGPREADLSQSETWNRGAYLVEAVGHCSACHTPRDAMGAEDGAMRFAGAMVDGWEAYGLGAHSPAPVAWTEDALYAYLRTGASDEHGPAGGPMQAVVHGLAALPDADVRAMAHYLADVTGPAPAAAEAGAVVAASEAAVADTFGLGRQIYDNACAVCHAPSAPLNFGAQLPLAFNSSLHAASPDNLIRSILDGHENVQNAGRGAMPAYRDVFEDDQLSALVTFLRRTQAPDKAPWADVTGTVARLRAEAAR